MKRKGLSQYYADLIEKVIIDHPSRIPNDNKWYHIWLPSVHSDDFWIRLERFIIALDIDSKYFFMIQPVLSNGQILTLGESTLITYNIDMQLLITYYNRYIAELEERYRDSFTGQTRIVLKNIGAAVAPSNKRAFTTTASAQSTTLGGLERSISAGFESMSQSFMMLPGQLASAIKDVIPQSSVTSPAMTAPVPTSTVQIPTTHTVVAPFSIPQDIWNRLSPQLKSFFIAKRDNTAWNGTANDLFLSDRSIFFNLPVEARNLINAARNAMPRTEAKTTPEQRAQLLASYESIGLKAPSWLRKTVGTSGSSAEIKQLQDSIKLIMNKLDITLPEPAVTTPSIKPLDTKADESIPAWVKHLQDSIKQLQDSNKQLHDSMKNRQLLSRLIEVIA